MKTILLSFAGAAALVALVVGGLYVDRATQKFHQETARQVYANSVAHQQGANSGIGIDCANMRNVSLSDADRHAYASLVLQGVTAYSGDRGLSDDAQDCVREARAVQATPISASTH